MVLTGRLRGKVKQDLNRLTYWGRLKDAGGCVGVCLCVSVCVFAPKAIDIGSVNPILSTSLQQLGIIYKNNTNMHVSQHAQKNVCV